MGLNVIQEKAAASKPININRNFEDVDGAFMGKLSELVRAITNTETDTIRILDVGCGNQRALSEMVALVSRTVKNVRGVGIDLNPISDETVDVSSIDSVAADAHDLTCLESETIDVGFSVATAQYLEDPIKAMLEVNRLLKPGGVFLWRFNTSPTSSHIEPHFKVIRDASPTMKPFFSAQHGIVINHKPFEPLPKPMTELQKLRAEKGLFIGSNRSSYRSECWVTQYGEESVLERLIREFSIMPKAHREGLDRAKLRAEFCKSLKMPIDPGIDSEDIPLSPLLQITAPSNSQ